MTHVVDSPIGPPDLAPRRSFLKRLAALFAGGMATLFPFAVGVGVLFDPLRRRGTNPHEGGEDDERFARIGPLDLLPADGVPRQFVLEADVVDAWTRSPAQRVGSVFLCHTTSGEGPKVTAFSSICPHLGCAVEYRTSDGQFECPCHESAFGKDGQKLFGPSLRGLDPLVVKLVGQNDKQEMWIELKRFRTGVAERVPIG